MGGPRGRPMPFETPFGAALRSAQNQSGNPPSLNNAPQYGHAGARSFAPMPFTGNTRCGTRSGPLDMYGAPGRYNAANRARGVQNDEFEQPGSRYHGENQHRNLDGRFGNAQDPNHRADTTPGPSNEDPTSTHPREFGGRGQPDDGQPPTYMRHNGGDFGGGQQ